MNRLKITIGILLLLTALCVTSLITIHRQCERFSAQTQEIIDCISEGDTEGAVAECDELLEMWEKFHDTTGIFIDGERLDPIREILAGLPALVAEAHPDLMNRLETLRTLAEDLFLEELPDLWHIL